MKTSKQCNQCKEIKDLTMFPKGKAHPDGHLATCSSCRKEWHKNYHKRPEVQERLRSYKRTPDQKAKDAIRRQSLKGMYVKAKSQAKRRKIQFELTLEEFKKARAPGACFYCGGGLPKEGSGLDRIDSSRGYAAENVIACCHSCNIMKSDKLSVLEMKSAVTAIKEQKNAILNAFFDKGIHLDHRRLFLSGEINEELATNFIKAIEELEAINSSAPIYLDVMSPGGDWHSALAMYDRMRSSSCPIIATAHGSVASSATVVFQAANERIMMPNATFLIHDGSQEFEGTPKSFEAWAQKSSEGRMLMYQIYSEASGRLPIFWENKCSHDTILSAEQTVEIGLADKILEPKPGLKE